MRKSEQRRELSLEALRADKNRVLVVAHRGSSGSAPENTIAAFEMALESGAEIIECDVRLTREGEVVVFHDRTLNRTTNGKGPVGERTLEELKKLDAGSWFSSKFRGERIPTLMEVLHLLNGRGLLNIELKADFREHRTNVYLKERVLKAVKESGAEERVFLASFNHTLMREIKNQHPRFFTAVIYKAMRDFASRPSRLVSRAHADVFVCGRWWSRRNFLRDLHDHQIPFFVYTINGEREAERMKQLGVDGVITNYPDVVVRVFKRSS